MIMQFKIGGGGKVSFTNGIEDGFVRFVVGWGC